MRSPIQDYLDRIAEQHADTGGAVADYIPELAAADPDVFALCVATVDGYVYGVGDPDHAYSIQSISKPFTYGLALADRGLEAVAEKVDVEPSGEAFNEISLAHETGRPRNPMINAGAITAASLVDGQDAEARFARVLDWYGAFARRDLKLDEAVYESEIATAHRNRAIAHMLREFDILECDPEAIVDQYIRQCSISVTTRDLALMAATFANGGIQPATGRRIAEPSCIEQVLSVMMSCGMYDAAGDWITSVGMPAKSGVSGGIIAVLPGQLGLAVFSPRLDAHGNSARGVALCERMSREMELHLMHVSRASRSAVRASYSLAQRPSRQRRPDDQQEILDRVAERCRVYELHGDLLFAGAETVIRTVVTDEPELAVVDVRAVDEVAAVARQSLIGLHERLRAAGGEGVLVDPEGKFPDPTRDRENETLVFRDRDAALRWCEDELLRRHGDTEDVAHSRAVEEHPLLMDLSDQARDAVRSRLREVSVQAGETILTTGERFAGVHIITDGEAIAEIEGPDGETLTLVSLRAGTSFGELALGTGGVQKTEIRATTDLRMLVLSADDLDDLTQNSPRIALEVWRAMVRDAYRVADKALHEGAVHTPEGRDA